MLWMSVLPEIPAYSREGPVEPDEIYVCMAAAAPGCTHFSGYGLWTSHREPNPRCARHLCPRWVNSSKCGKPQTCHCLFDLQGLCEEQTCLVS